LGCYIGLMLWGSWADDVTLSAELPYAIPHTKPSVAINCPSP
jgi:hypothetical protein